MFGEEIEELLPGNGVVDEELGGSSIGLETEPDRLGASHVFALSLGSLVHQLSIGGPGEPGDSGPGSRRKAISCVAATS